jgi:uncharacterized delta-60 repeat protein
MSKYLSLVLFWQISFFSFGQSGNVDRSFANNGIGIYNLNKNGHGQALISETQADGKILVAGTYKVDNYFNDYEIYLTRLNSNGSVDSSFGQNGAVYLGIGEEMDSPNQIVVDKKGRIILNATSLNYTSNSIYQSYATIFRLKSNGSLDSTFNNDGILETGLLLYGEDHKVEFIDDTLRYINAGKIHTISEQGNFLKEVLFERALGDFIYFNNRFFTVFNNYQGEVICYVFDKNGKSIADGSRLVVPYYTLAEVSIKRIKDEGIFVSGRLTRPNNGGDGAFICKINLEGLIDSTFGNDGMYVIPNLMEWDIFPLKNGNYVGFSSQMISNDADSALTNLTMIKPNGVVDSSYGVNGTLTLDPRYYVNYKLDSSETLYLNGGAGRFIISRISLSSGPDSTFGRQGYVEIAIDRGLENVIDISISKDDKIIILDDRRLVRLNKYGRLDSTFNSTGIKEFTDKGPFSLFKSMSDGKIITLSSTYELVSGAGPINYKHLLTRVNEDGTLDKTFGTYGVVELEFTDTYIKCMVIQKDGKVVLGGGNSKSIMFLRLNSNGDFDDSFGVNGIAQYTINGVEDWITDLKLDSEEKIISIGGAVFREKLAPNMSTNVKRVLLMRFLANGTIDYTFNGSGIKLLDLPGTPEVYTMFNEYAYQLDLTSDGQMVIAGSSANKDKYFYSVTKLNKDGSPVLSYATKGINVFNKPIFDNKTMKRFVIQKDGKLLFIGSEINDRKIDIYFYREEINGIVDTTFGYNGFSYHLFKDYDLRAQSVAISSIGQIIGAGTLKGDYLLIGLSSKARSNLKFTMPTNLLTNSQTLVQYNSLSKSPVIFKLISPQLTSVLKGNILYTFLQPGTIILKAYQIESEMYEADSASCEIEVFMEPDIRDLKGIQIYPVPAKEIINLPNTKEGKKVRIINLMGQLVYEGLTIENSTTIYIGELNNGIYLIKIGDLEEAKFVIQGQ